MTEPKLPPGWTWVPTPVAPDFGILTNPYGTKVWHTLAAAEASAWLTFGITREKWEVMERDHRAMEALRNSIGFVGFQEWDGGHGWEASIDEGSGFRDDPADAIIMALGD